MHLGIIPAAPVCDSWRMPPGFPSASPRPERSGEPGSIHGSRRCRSRWRAGSTAEVAARTEAGPRLGGRGDGGGHHNRFRSTTAGIIGRLRLHIVAPDPDPGPISGPLDLPERRKRSAAEGIRIATAGCARFYVRGWAPDRGPGRRWVRPRNRFRPRPLVFHHASCAENRKRRPDGPQISGARHSFAVCD